MFSTATVNIKITDINDKNPEFSKDIYNFSVEEGTNETSVGYVHAIDADEGVNALVSYFIPTDLPFSIDNETGEIRTIKPLDYETQKSYQFVVTAKDGAPDPRIATATVSIEVLDIEDELPIFSRAEYIASVPENMPDYFVTDVMVSSVGPNASFIKENQNALGARSGYNEENYVCHPPRPNRFISDRREKRCDLHHARFGLRKRNPTRFDNRHLRKYVQSERKHHESYNKC